MSNKVLVYVEINNNKIEKVSKEIIAKASESFVNSEVNAVLISDENSYEHVYNELCGLNISKLYVIVDKLFDSYNTCLFSDVLSNFLRENTPDIFLIGATTNGRDLAPRTASNLDIGLTADCTDLQIDENGNLLATRPTYGGKLLATIVSRTKPNFATVRSGAFACTDLNSDKEPEIIKINPNVNNIDALFQVISCKPKPQAEDWTCAEIIVSGGLGLNSKDNFDLIYKLSELIGAKPAATRAAVELGWAPESIQVGQTGSSVSPKLYLAFGISGAMQHMVGISNADKIIAINTNTNAPIMSQSDIAIVADAAAVLKDMIEKLSVKSKQAHL